MQRNVYDRKSEEDTIGTEPNNAELQVPYTTFKTL